MGKKVNGNDHGNGNGHHEGVIYCSRDAAENIYYFMLGRGDGPRKPVHSGDRNVMEIAYNTKNKTELFRELGNNFSRGIYQRI